MVQSVIRVLLTVLILALGGVLFVATLWQETRPRTAQVQKELPEIVYAIPGEWEDVLRIAVMILAGLTLGLLVLITQQFTEMRIDKDDKFVLPLGGLALSFFLLTLFAGIEVSSRLKLQFITWRTPLAGLAYLSSTWSLVVLLFRIRAALRRAKATKATVKMTMTDTSKRGPDIDLVDGQPVVHETTKQDAYDAGHSAGVIDEAERKRNDPYPLP